MSQLRDETPPLEEQEAARASQGEVGVAGQGREEQLPEQDSQVSQGGQWSMSHECHMTHYTNALLAATEEPGPKEVGLKEVGPKEVAPKEVEPKEVEQEDAEVCPPLSPVQAAPLQKEEEGNTLDKLFRKTLTKPHIYWLPLTEEQAQQRVEGDRQREKDRESRQREREAREKEVQRSGERGVQSRQQGRR